MVLPMLFLVQYDENSYCVVVVVADVVVVNSEVFVVVVVAPTASTLVCCPFTVFSYAWMIERIIYLEYSPPSITPAKAISGSSAGA